MADILHELEVRFGVNNTPYVIAQVEWDGSAVDRPWLRLVASYTEGGDATCLDPATEGFPDSYVVRGSTEPHPGDGTFRTFIDPQAPFDREVTYTPEWANDPIIADWQASPWAVTGVGDTVTMPSVGDVQVISRPGDIVGTMYIPLLGNGLPRSSPATGTLVRVQRRARPVSLWDVRGSESGSIDLCFTSLVSWKTFQSLVADGAPLLSRHGTRDYLWQPAREIVDQAEIARTVSGNVGLLARLDFTVVDDPEPGALATVGTFDDMETVFENGIAVGVGLQLTGLASSYASTPDDASLDITGDLDLRVDANSRYAWRPPAGEALVAKWTATGDQRSYRLSITSGGFLQLWWSSTGANLLSAQSTVPIPNTATDRLTVRATIDVDNGAAGRTITFYTGTGGVGGSFSALGSAVVQGGVTSIFSSSAVAEVGSIDAGASDRFTGYVHGAQIRSGIAGTVVANPDFSLQTAGAGSFTDSAGRLWTVQSGAALVEFFTFAQVASFFAGENLLIFADIAVFDWWTEANP